MCRECQCDACKEQGDSGKSHRESVFHIDRSYRYAFNQMDRDSFDQCTVDPAGSIQPEYFAEYARISFFFCGIFHFFRSAGTFGIVLYQCCDRSDDRADRIGDLLFYLCLWTEVCVVNQDPFKEYVKQSEPDKRTLEPKKRTLRPEKRTLERKKRTLGSKKQRLINGG